LNSDRFGILFSASLCNKKFAFSSLKLGIY
jgi:hypothetical protein